jgi:hypothetical protein
VLNALKLFERFRSALARSLEKIDWSAGAKKAVSVKSLSWSPKNPQFWLDRSSQDGGTRVFDARQPKTPLYSVAGKPKETLHR